MKITPRYDGTVVLTIDDAPKSQHGPVVRQRRRFEALLASLSDDDWDATTRCDGWRVRDVVAHLVTVNAFWTSSVGAGVSGSPTRVLQGFDPAATPPLLVDTMHELTSRDIFDQFAATNAAFLETLDGLSEAQWEASAESPAGHVPVRVLAQHALWDCWVHERDVVLPLGIAPAVESDEVVSCLRYAAAISPVLGLGLGVAERCTLAVVATDPDVRFRLEVGDSVELTTGDVADGIPCLRGDALALTEALSLRVPLDDAAPTEWRRFLGGLEAAFDAG